MLLKLRKKRKQTGNHTKITYLYVLFWFFSIFLASDSYKFPSGKQNWERYSAKVWYRKAKKEIKWMWEGENIKKQANNKEKSMLKNLTQCRRSGIFIDKYSENRERSKKKKQQRKKLPRFAVLFLIKKRNK